MCVPVCVCMRASGGASRGPRSKTRSVKQLAGSSKSGGVRDRDKDQTSAVVVWVWMEVGCRIPKCTKYTHAEQRTLQWRPGMGGAMGGPGFGKVSQMGAECDLLGSLGAWDFFGGGAFALEPIDRMNQCLRALCMNFGSAVRRPKHPFSGINPGQSQP